MTAETPIYRLADEYVDAVAAANPLVATSIGVPGHDAEMTDFSPTGHEERARLARETLARLRDLPTEGERDRVAAGAIVERLELAIELHEARDYLRSLSVLGSPLQAIRSAFDLMARHSEQAWADIAQRLDRVPEGLAGLRASLEEGLARDVRATRRQALACAQQAEVWSGAQEGTPAFFDTLVEAYDRADIGAPALRADLERAAAVAGDAYAAMGEYLRQRYAPHAAAPDPVGPDRYALYARAFTGARLDLEETYRWGWAEVERLEREMEQTAARIAPGESLTEVRAPAARAPR